MTDMVKREVWLISGDKTLPEEPFLPQEQCLEVETRTADCKRDGNDKITWFPEVRGLRYCSKNSLLKVSNINDTWRLFAKTVEIFRSDEKFASAKILEVPFSTPSAYITIDKFSMLPTCNLNPSAYW